MLNLRIVSQHMKPFILCFFKHVFVEMTFILKEVCRNISVGERKELQFCSNTGCVFFLCFGITTETLEMLKYDKVVRQSLTAICYWFN